MNELDLTHLRAVAGPNPLLAEALRYYAERRAMSNPKGWAHVGRVVEQALSDGVLVATEAQATEARAVLALLSGGETLGLDPDAVVAALPEPTTLGDVISLELRRESNPAEPLTVSRNVKRACAWSDYRSAYGVSADPSVRALEHKAFCAGWDAAHSEELNGVQR